MDYSASIHEVDDPAASPWGNSPSLSSQQARTGFAGLAGELAGEAPNSPFSYVPQGAGLEHSASHPDLARPGTASTESGTEVSNADDVNNTQAAGVSHPGASQETSDVNEQTGRPHGQAPQAQQQQQPPPQPRPQFRLQAKITGLERTGKKDPVLRFDVHVGLPHQ
ncbi:hypothetical protein E4U43_007292 [Claviceps pusilla]|uniref:Uncharacterized protein n=1 Tax=Claviceps pusilla TaxID=123648 RepID=A0A9P7NCV8_9HYPO|nr:hypothetical protein E4U43_007292 [Claviceps pusilla]